MISENKTLTEILNAFRDAYEDNTNLIDRIQKLHNLKQDSHESVADFADKLETTVHWIDQLDDKALYNKLDIMKSVFLNGLSNKRIPDLMMHLKDDQSKDYYVVRSKAIALESENAKNKHSVKAVDCKSNIVDHLNALTESMTKLVEQVAEMKNQRIEVKPEGVLDVRPTARAQVTCFRCGNFGHIARYCNHNWQPRGINPPQNYRYPQGNRYPGNKANYYQQQHAPQFRPSAPRGPQVTYQAPVNYMNSEHQNHLN